MKKRQKNSEGASAPKGGENGAAKPCFRAADLSVKACGGDDDKKEVRATVSSEEPYYRSCMWNEKTGQYEHGYEVLGHEDGEIDFSRMKDGLVIQDTHYGDQIGIIRKPEVKDGKLGGVIEFGCGERAQEIRRDAEAGIRRNMSIGYFVDEYKLVGEKDGHPVWRAVRWTPYEGSFVSVPADTGVGVGRSDDEPAAKPAVAKQKGIQKMEPEVKAGLSAEQVVECFRLAKAANVEHAEVNELVKSGKSFDEIRETLEGKLEKHMEELAKKAAKPEMPPKKDAPAFSEGERREVERKYSLQNVMRALAGDSVDIGYEREISKEIEQKTGRRAQGIIVPDFIRAANPAGVQTLGTPDYSSTEGQLGNSVAGSGHNVIATDLLAGSFIEALRDALVLTRAGMRTLSGLVGDIAIPKGGKVQAAWITQENGDATKTNPTFGQIPATPKTCGAYVDITRKLLLQASIDVQGFVVGELVYAIAHALEDAGFNGAGSSGVPLGLVSQITQTVSFTAGAPTLAKLLEMVAIIDEANGNIGPQSFIGRPSVWALLGQTLDWTAVQASDVNVSGVTSGKHLLDTTTNTCQGYPFIRSNIAPAKTLLFGDFSQLMLCLWSGTDILVDQYSQCTKGALRVVALQDADFIVRQTAAFAKGTTLLA